VTARDLGHGFHELPRGRAAQSDGEGSKARQSVYLRGAACLPGC
jgi:hypothetical protein